LELSSGSAALWGIDINFSQKGNVMAKTGTIRIVQSSKAGCGDWLWITDMNVFRAVLAD
jgi:hypothetical protein